MNADHPLAQDTLAAAVPALGLHFPRSTVTFPDTGERLDGAALEEASSRFASGLLSRGVRPGDVVGLVTPTTVKFLVGFFGVLRAGAAVSLLPAPSGLTGGGDAVARLARAVNAADMRHLVIDDTHTDAATQLKRLCPALTLLGADLADPCGAPLPQVTPGDLAVVQFTSGSTGNPKGVMLSHGAALAGLRAIVISSGLRDDDVLVQWVPHYHDMGLFGLLAAVLNGGSAVVLSPLAFIRQPAAVLRQLSECGGTLLTGPDFSYQRLAGTATPALLAELDLRRWRLAYNGAEPVRADTVATFTERMTPAGVAPSVMYPVYGMAEATLAITFPAPDSAPQVQHVDRDALATHGQVRPVSPDDPGARALVGVGRPVDGMQLRLVSQDGQLCHPGTLGEIQISGPAVTTGYYRNPQASRDAFDGPWFRTGDLGFHHGQNLFIAGRRKEMIIVRGANFFPEDIEAIARDVPGVHRRHCVAIATADHDGDEYVAVIVEVARGVAAGPLAKRVRRAVAETLDLTAITVHTTAPNSLPRTTSGKWQRTLAWQRLSRDHDDKATRKPTSVAW